MEKEVNKLKSFSVLFFIFLTSCSYILQKSTALKVDLGGQKVRLHNVGVNPKIIKNKDDIFVISISKNITKLSTTEKNISWVKSINTIPEDNFTFDEDNIYFNGINNNFYILNYKTGDIEYIYINSNVGTINNVKKPIIYNNKIIAFFNDNRVIIFDKISKKVLFDKKYNGDFVEKIENNTLKINEEFIDLKKL